MVSTWLERGQLVKECTMFRSLFSRLQRNCFDDLGVQDVSF